MRYALALAFVVVGCGAGTQAESPRTADVAAPITAPTSDCTTAPASITLEEPPPPPPDRFRTRTIASDDERPHWVGRKIDLDLKDADIHNVCRLLADVGKTNIVIGDDVQGRVTVTMHQVPWDQALAVVLEAKGLTMERDGNIILVTRAAPPPH